jgi:hypothetical protein
MTERKIPGSKPPPQNTGPRDLGNSPGNGRESGAPTADRPKSSTDSAIPSEKLNAANDK